MVADKLRRLKPRYQSVTYYMYMSWGSDYPIGLFIYRSSFQGERQFSDATSSLVVYETTAASDMYSTHIFHNTAEQQHKSFDIQDKGDHNIEAFIAHGNRENIADGLCQHLEAITLGFWSASSKWSISDVLIDLCDRPGGHREQMGFPIMQEREKNIGVAYAWFGWRQI